MQCFPFKNFRVIFFQNICGGFCFVLFFPVGNAEVNVKYSHGLGTVGTHQCHLPHENFKVCYSNLALEKQFSPNVFWLPHKHQNIIFWFPWTSAETGIRGKAGIPIRHQHGPCLCRIWSASSVFLCQLQLVYFSSCTVFCATAIDFSLFFPMWIPRCPNTRSEGIPPPLPSSAMRAGWGQSPWMHFSHGRCGAAVGKAVHAGPVPDLICPGKHHFCLKVKGSFKLWRVAGNRNVALWSTLTVRVPQFTTKWWALHEPKSSPEYLDMRANSGFGAHPLLCKTKSLQFPSAQQCLSS